MRVGADLVQVVCPLCECGQGRQLFAGRDRYLGRDGLFAVTECRSCGFLFTNPRPTREAMARFYPDEYGPYQQFLPTRVEIFVDGSSFLSHLKAELKYAVLTKYYDCRLEESHPKSHVLDAMPKMISSVIERIAYRFFQKRNLRIPIFGGNGKVLDIGCGNGLYLLLLKQLGWNAEGFDLADHATPSLRQAGIRVHTERLERLLAFSESYNVITMWHVLEHLYDPLGDLKIIRRLLSNDGLLLVEVPNSTSIPAKLFGGDWFPWDLPRHLSHFSPDSLTRMLKKAGFRVNGLTHLRATSLPNTLRYWVETNFQHSMLGAIGQESMWCRWVRWLGYPLKWCRSGEHIFVVASGGS
jgi:2-polyprenyl-3-methyl-5-hydroxy-6-metoxy-1,4-benzoquinol methylase